MKTKLSLLLIVAFGIGLFFGFLWGQSASLSEWAAPEVSNEAVVQSANLMIDFGDGRVSTYPNVSIIGGETAFQLTGRVSEENELNFVYEEYEGLGVLVTQIGDRKGGDEDKYWQYWVNGVSPDIGAGQYAVHSGDVIEWKFLKYAGNEE